jgi:DNA-binding beta-propeller fold protein YncE
MLRRIQLKFSILLIAVLLFSSCWEGGAHELVYVETLKLTGGEIGEPFGIAVHKGDLYISDGEKGVIWRLSGTELTVFAEGFDTPSHIAFDRDGDLFIADTGSHTIEKVDPKGERSIVAGTRGKAGFNDGAASEAKFNGPVGLAVDGEGRVFVADTYNDKVRVIENGSVRTLAEKTEDGKGFRTPLGLAVWHDKLLVADSGNRRIVAVEPDGRAWTLAGSGEDEIKDGLLFDAAFSEPAALAILEDGSILVADGDSIRAITSGAAATVRTLTQRRRGHADGTALFARFNRPSGIAVSPNAKAYVADSDNSAIRVFSAIETKNSIAKKQDAGEAAEQFRTLAPGRWPYDPPAAKRDIAGTLAEIRGDMEPGSDQVWFHNGLDIAGAYGEAARFIRTEKILRPNAAELFGTLRELIRMPQLGYIHIRLGRDLNNVSFGDERFLFDRDAGGKITDVRVRRGTKFNAGEPIGTLNAMNHVHLIAGRSGNELNALAALDLPGVSDSRPPVIESVELFTDNWEPVETPAGGGRITLNGKVRVVAAAFDQKDGNPARRKLGIYRAGYEILTSGGQPVFDAVWTLNFLRFPPNDAVRFAYANGSRSGATGETRFRYIVTNFVNGDEYREGFLDISTLANGIYILRVNAADFFGNITSKDIQFEVKR